MIYVDDMQRRVRVGNTNGIWSHLFADTSAELMAFAQLLGLKPEWVQHAGTYREHFDVTNTVRAKAIAAGAQEISYPRGTARLLEKKRALTGRT